MNCDAKLTQTSLVAPPASGARSSPTAPIWVNFFLGSRKIGADGSRVDGPAVVDLGGRGEIFAVGLNRSLTTARCDHREAREGRAKGR